MTPPKTTMAIGQQQQQQFLNSHQSPQANKGQSARSVRNRKAKQSQPNNIISNNSNPIEKTQLDVANARAQHGATKPADNGQTQPVNLAQQKEQIEPNNIKIQQSLNTSKASVANAKSNATTTNGAKSTHSPIKVNNSGATDSPAPSERTTIKQRKEAEAAAASVAAATLARSSLENQNQELDKQQTSSDRATRRLTAPNNDNNNKKNLIAMSHEKQQAQSRLSSQTSNNLVAAAAAALSVAENNNNNASVLTNKHQTSSLVDDDIDAGIELDGSSNSGSSVKDANEDQMKSNSVSPVMLSAQLTLSVAASAEPLVAAAASPVAQETTTTTTKITSNPITATTISGESILDSVKKPQASSELKHRSGASQLVAIEPIHTAVAISEAIANASTATTTRPTTSVAGEQSLPASSKAASLCLEAATADAIGSSSPIKLSPKNNTKKTTMTRDELAKERQSIDADELLIQQRLESKQRKSSGASTCSLSTIINGSGDATCDGGANNQFNNVTFMNKSGITNAETTDNKPLSNQIGESINVLENDGNNKSSSATQIKRQFSADTSASGLQVAASSNGGLKSLCKNCGSHVYQMERMLAEKSLYHKQCFRCFQCKIQLRIDNYASHEGQVYCKLHHKQIFQPQVKFNTETDADSVAKSSK